MSGLLTQTITSQIWKSSFTKPLSEYPILTLSLLEYGIYHCDACNSSRKSTVHAVVSDPPYQEMGFEAVVNDESSCDSDDRSEAEEKDFILGRFCAARARVFHKFSHWEVHKS
jgi:hypothetical protein